MPITFLELSQMLELIPLGFKRRGATEEEINAAEIWITEELDEVQPRYRLCAEAEIANPTS